MKNILIFVLLAIIVFLYSFDSSNSALKDGTDINVSYSTGKLLKAYVREVNIDGSVMVSKWYQVVVEDKLGQKRVILAADKTQGLVIQWIQSKKLSVCYGEGTQINSFNNSFGFSSEDRSYLSGEVILTRKQSYTQCKEA